MLVKLNNHYVSSYFSDCTLVVDVRLYEETLYLDYRLTGQLTDLLQPVTEKSVPQQKDGLWDHTCFEAFLGIAGQSEYCEFNFSPSGDWAGYAFKSYRERTVWKSSTEPSIECVNTGSDLHLSASLALAEMPQEFVGKPWLLGLSAVLETNGQAKSWWAIEHAKPEPDFHLQAGWIALESLSGKP